jgi:two-component system, OmpR family, response regulator ResD
MQSMHAEQKLVFIVEDDVETAELVALHLRHRGFAVRAFPGRSALNALRQQLPAVVLLNEIQPPSGGFDVFTFLKAHVEFRHIKTIVVSTRGTADDVVYGLDSGADDYLVKPFSPQELVGRVSAVLRSEQRAAAHRILQMGEFIADLDSRTITLNGSELGCSSKEFDLLVFFMRHPGKMMNRHDLLTKLQTSGSTSQEIRMVDVYIRRLRDKIEQDASLPSRLMTRRGGGYCLVAG